PLLRAAPAAPREDSDQDGGIIADPGAPLSPEGLIDTPSVIVSRATRGPPDRRQASGQQVPLGQPARLSRTQSSRAWYPEKGLLCPQRKDALDHSSESCPWLGSPARAVRRPSRSPPRWRGRRPTARPAASVSWCPYLPPRKRSPAS